MLLNVKYLKHMLRWKWETLKIDECFLTLLNGPSFSLCECILKIFIIVYNPIAFGELLIFVFSYLLLLVKI